jgi:streptomycin 6-kinase
MAIGRLQPALDNDGEDDMVHGDLETAELEWRAGLPQVIEEFASRWSLELGPPYTRCISAAWVAPARTTTGDRLVLKLGWTHDEALHEADGLRAWDGRGTVRLIDSLAAGSTTALLLEACEPGTQLSLVLPELEQDVVVAGLLRRLWIEPPDRHPFRPLKQMCDQWADAFERACSLEQAGVLEGDAAVEARGVAPLDPGIARAGIALFRELPTTAEHAVLLATDLHHDNVLAAEREPWLVIDPKPYVGDPAYDPVQHMLNFPGRLAADPAGLATRMAGLLDLDPGRVKLWLFARCVQESATDPPLREVASRLAP